MRRMLILLALCPAPALGQTPDARGEVALPTPTYRGIKPTAPIPVELHVRNEGGSDRQGLCVISSVLAAGMAQGVPGLNIPGYDERTGRNMPGKGSALWREAKSQPGGYSPDKLAALLNRIMPGEKWTSYIGTDPREIEKLIKQGYRVCSTMSTGQQYGYRGIHHFVNDTAYTTNGWSCVVDNNDPGMFHWMPAAERARRFRDGGQIWAFAWLRLPSQNRTPAALLFLAAFAMMGAATILFLNRGRADDAPIVPDRDFRPDPLRWASVPSQQRYGDGSTYLGI
jgi:hypothetical protein